ncbi:apical sushi protein [Plasmodium sp. gorilla clade G2]|uniref:apical sushi protein n=1 Tax=Plasmodium sp. gorilla clade G2 TaxID=880535 RepID=UPI000D212DBB|nr:apical sushi protein [Plasmodium sp. gorilla clade G2]SOV11198.1 apical sushi protein [Plasmodium sp. gorilla clade G2]
MKIIYHVLIFLLHYNIIIKAKENKNDNFLNGIYKLQNIWRNTTLGELDLKKANMENAEGIIEKFNDSKKNDISRHPHFRSKLSFLEHKNHNDMGIVSNHQHKIKDHKNDEHISQEIIDMKPQLASQEMWRKGENFYMHGATNTNEQNDDEDFFESFHNNHNSNIKINSPCFDLQEKEMCSNNKGCFYDDTYKACFQNCKLLNEKNCSLYSECKHTFNGCENEGYLNIEVFGSNLGGDVRACELFESEGSCYLMEQLFKKLSQDKKETNFNCVWLSYKHELKSYNDENEPKTINNNIGTFENENENENKNKNKYIYMNNVENEHKNHHLENVHKNHHLKNPYHEDINNNKHNHFNYHVLSSSVPRQIVKNEKFLSLLELNLKGKKKEINKNNKNNKKKKKNDDEDEEDDDDIEDEDDDLDIEGKNNEFNDEEGEENSKDLKNNNIDENEEDGSDDEDDLFNNELKNKKINNNNNNNNNKNKNKNKKDTNKKNNKIKNEFHDDNNELSEENLINDDEKKNKKIKNKDINETDNISENNEIEISSTDLTEQYEDKYNYDKKNNINNINTNNNFNNINTFGINKDILHNNKHINHSSHIHNEEKDILKHNFYGRDKNGTYEIIKVETHICANLNEKPNPSTLLEGALIAENEAELQKLKKKYKVTDNEICVRPTNSSYVSLIPDKKYYLLGEKIEFKCQEGYKIIGTTNIGVCTGRNIISPNITCESLTNFDDIEKDNIQKMNNIINSASKYTLYNIIIIVFIIINLFFCT